MVFPLDILCKELIALQHGMKLTVSDSPSERLRRLVGQIELAVQVGLDVFGVGKHHRSFVLVCLDPH